MKRLFTLLLISFAALSCEMIDEKLDDFLGRDDSSVTTIANNQIWYTSTDGEIVEPYSGVDNNYADFGVNIVSNTYVDGKGVIEFDGDVTAIGMWAFGECSSLTSVTIPDSVTSIGYAAFTCCSSLTSITIPDRVTTIGDRAFEGCSSLQEFNGKFASEDGRCLIIDGVLNSFAIGCGATEYTIPDSVTTIGYSAFSECSSLTSVTIPDSVSTIGELAFLNCRSLTSVTIPDSVTKIGRFSFGYCNSLINLTIPDSVTTIGDAAFCYCSSLQEFNGKFASEDGRCLIIVGTLIAFAPAGLAEYTIPDSVTTIEKYAFGCCSSLTSVTIGDSVTSIGWGAFDECSSLTSVYCKAITPPAGGSSMFSSNALGRMIYVPMESVEAYKSASYWSDYADAIVGCDFENGVAVTPKPANNEIWYTNGSTTQATTPSETSAFGANIVSNTYDDEKECWVIKFDGKVTKIGDYAFYQCEAITSVTLGQSVEYIGFKAFDDCISITEITIPDSVHTIGVQAFCYCTSLSSFKGKFASEDGKCLIVDGRLIAFAIGCDDVGEYVIPDGVTEITNYSVYYCKSMSSLVIPESVIRIGEGAFCDCSNLNSVTINDKVEFIGEVAFNLCHSLTSVYCKATIPPVAEHLYWDSWGAFDGNASDRKIYVPAESVEAYKSAYRWSEYASDIVGYNF